MTNKYQDLAYDILEDESNDRDGSFFWFSTHKTESAAKKKIKKLNFVLLGSGAKADYQMDNNYMGRGYGVYIENFTDSSAKKLIERFKLKVD